MVIALESFFSSILPITLEDYMGKLELAEQKNQSGPDDWPEN